ncbi:MAG: sigma-70 family RNA polymerase sigma factor [Planctomycetota bacterium]|nr:sigma-70 family RNA polymerase sigma factor [Planctomycetota bacterium]
MDDNEQEWRDWVQKLAAGDEEVATEFWEIYGDRLQRLANRHLTVRLHRRVDPDDIVLSACRTFLRRAQGGEFQLPDSESLWRLMCAITVTKVRWHARFHLRKKRGIDRERHFESQGGDSLPAVREVAGDDPTPEEAAEFADQFEHLMAGLDEEEQQLVQLKLEQYTNVEIAERLGCSERTVRRIVKRVQSRLNALLQESIS